MRIVIYSANIGNYDYFYHPEIIDKNAIYCLFTDNKYFKSDTWSVIKTNQFNINHLDDRKMARYFKINSHLILPEHDISIWVDHCFKIKITNVIDLLDQINFNDKDIMLYKHPWRDCIYEEANVCIKNNLDKEEIIAKQMEKYKKNFFPKNYGLFSTGFMVRKNNTQIKNFNDLWWQEVLNNSGRDQLSQCYAAWKTNLKINPIIINESGIYDNSFLEKKIKHVKTYLINQ